MVSRLTHYYLRVKRLETSDEALQKARQELLDTLERRLACFIWKSSEEEDDNALNREDKTKKGAIPKGSTQNTQDQSKNTQDQSKDTQEEGKSAPYAALLRKLEATIEQLKTSGTVNLQQDAEGQKCTEEEKKKKKKKKAKDLSDSDNSDVEDQYKKTRNGQKSVGKKDRNGTSSKSRQDRHDTTDELDSDYEKQRRRGRRHQGDDHRRRDGERETGGQWNRQNREGDRRGREQGNSNGDQQRRGNENEDRRGQDQRNSGDDQHVRRDREDSRDRRDRSDDRYSTRSYEGYRGRNFRQSRRIEHWKLSFSGDNRATSVENFLYKLKKIADREGVSRRGLLRDIHLILEGQASDWFFTYVDEFENWDDFEEGIRFRFGNPNQDQGIRQRIQERKQQRGETFSAFVTEIERLNKMLSRPLSRRRKFEVVWDNMRPHYRSKTSIVTIRDLDHLIRLNHRIDAADTSLHSHPETRNSESRHQRNVNQVECATPTDGSDEPEEVDAIDTRSNARGQRTGQRNQPTTTRTAEETNQQTGQTRQSGQPQGNVCWNCRKTGHNWRDCREPRAIFCYGCGELGRTIRSCQKCADSNRGRGRQNQGNQ